MQQCSVFVCLLNDQDMQIGKKSPPPPPPPLSLDDKVLTVENLGNHGHKCNFNQFFNSLILRAPNLTVPPEHKTTHLPPLVTIPQTRDLTNTRVI